jgi:Domain of unknown function (DUF5602)
MRKLNPFLVPTVLLVMLFLPLQDTVSGQHHGHTEGTTRGASPLSITVSGRHDHTGHLVTIEPRQIGPNPDALIWTWGRFQRDIPLSIGVSFTEQALDPMFTAAFDDFPRELPHLTAPGLEPARVYDLPFPAKVRKTTPFDHMGWFANAQGHNPPGVFTFPHADVHFFMITVKERQAISGQLDDKMLTYPPEGFLPADFCLPLFTSVPPFCKLLTELTETDVPGSNDTEQGLHWVDQSAPELRGELFRQINIFGTYDGKVVFWEPMITKQFFEDVRSFLNDLQSTGKTIVLTFAIKQPEKFQETSYYPTQYTVSYDAEVGEFTVSLDDFVLRKAANH